MARKKNKVGKNQKSNPVTSSSQQKEKKIASDLRRSDMILKAIAPKIRQSDHMTASERKLRELGYGTYMGAVTFINADNILRMAALKPDYDKTLYMLLDYYSGTDYMFRYIKDKYVVKYVKEELANKRSWTREQGQLAAIVKEETGITSAKKSSFTYMNEVGYTLQWADVVFQKNSFTIYAPTDGKVKFQPYKIMDPLATTSLNYIKEYLQDRMPRIYGIVKQGKLNIEGKIDLGEAIRMLESPTYSKIVQQRVAMKSMTRSIFRDYGSMTFAESMSKASRLSKADFEKYKSKFVKFLLDRQIYRYKIIPCNEEITHLGSASITENAFIFTLQSKYTQSDVVLVVENLNPDRATLLFRISAANYEDCLKTIHAFLRSNEINKRSNLRISSELLQSLKAYSFYAVNHRDDYPYTWKYVMESKLRNM